MSFLIQHPKLGLFFSVIADPGMCEEGAVITDLVKKKHSTDGINWANVPDVCWFPEKVKASILQSFKDLRYAERQDAIKVAKNCIAINSLAPILDACFSQKGGGMLHLWNYDQNYNSGVVYFLIDQAEVVYIGQTTTRDRVCAHKRDKVFDLCMYTPIILDRGHLAVEEMLIEHFSPKYNNCQVSKRSGRKPYGIAQLQELCFNFHPRSKMATP